VAMDGLPHAVEVCHREPRFRQEVCKWTQAATPFRPVSIPFSYSTPR
jgi:hypothetical protein